MLKISTVMALFFLALSCQEETQFSMPDMPGVEHAQPKGAKAMLPAFETEREKLTSFKGDQFGDYRSAHPELYGITVPPGVPVRPAAEYEPAQKLLITYSSSTLAAGIEQNLVDIAKYGKEVVDIVVIYGDSSTKQSFVDELGLNGVAENELTWINLDNDSVWMRDYGPISILGNDGKIAFADFRYYHQRVYDDAIPGHLSAMWNVTDYRVPLEFEGGSFFADTKGNCFSTHGLMMHNPVDADTVKAYMKSYLGCQTMSTVAPLDGEGTTHVDMYVKNFSDSGVIVGSYDPAEDAVNAQLTDETAAFFEANGWTVYRMPMPTHSDGNFRTFINSLFVNKVNMWPAYSIEKDKEAQALQVWQQAMPDFQHVAMNADDVITWGGAIHCVTMTVASGTMAPLEDGPDYACGGDWDCYPGVTAAGCDGVTYEGCCDGAQLKYCENDQLKTMDCSSKPNCGWDAEKGFYNCGTSGAADPSGANPLACGGGVVCEPDCDGKQCGGDGCGGVCGACSPGHECTAAGACTPLCTADCTNKVCGDDGCGGSCGECAAGQTCSGGVCEVTDPGQPVDECNGITYEGCCNGEELKYCENGTLKVGDCSAEASCGWDAANSFYNCGTAGGGDPTGAHPKNCTAECVPDCAGKDCGDDGCGGSCGGCVENMICVAGNCQPGTYTECPEGTTWNGSECATPPEETPPADRITEGTGDGGGSGSDCSTGGPARSGGVPALLLFTLLTLALFPRRRPVR